MALEHGVFLDLETVDSGDLDRCSLERSLPRWTWHEFTPAADAPRRVRDADVVVSNKVRLDEEVLAVARRLSLVVVAATGTNNVDAEAAIARGITVCNIRDYCSRAVAQHVATLVLNLLSGLPWYLDAVRRGEWSRARQFCLQDRPIREVAGLAFGVVGHGSLGQAAAATAGALGMEVLVAERRGRSPRPGRLPFEEVLSRADVLSLHCPLTPETRGLLSRRELESMKPTAIVINTARGGIVDEHDLAAALRAGTIAGAGVDTLGEEPPPPDHPLLAGDIPNLLITPHNAWASRPARQAAMEQIAAVIRAYADGRAMNVVAAPS